MAYTPEEYQGMIAGGCPWCGEPLELRKGKYGEFLACSEWCGFTKSIPGRSYQPPPSPKKKGCLKCKDSGLLPFIKNGKTIPHVSLFCSCHQASADPEREPERYKRFMPEDFDFPMSYSYYRSLCQEQGWLEPCSENFILPESAPEPIFKPRPAQKEPFRYTGHVIAPQNQPAGRSGYKGLHL